MIRISIIVLSFLMLSCESQYSGDFDVSGYCYDTCGGSPLTNYHVQYRNEGAFFETYTDANGYFELKGSYSFSHSSEKLPDPEFINFYDTTNSSTCCAYFSLNERAKFENDTIYGYHTVNSIFNVEVSPNLNTSIEDTVFVRLSGYKDYNGNYPPTYYSNTATYSISYNTYYVGPFYDNQVLDTVKTRVEPHVGNSEGSFGCVYIFRGPNLGNGKSRRGMYSFVNGQRNIGCNAFQFIELDLDK